MRRLFPPVLFFVNLIIVLSIWASVHWQSVIIGSIADRLLAIGSLSGLLAFYLILWQLLLIGRVSWIEKHWGHDVLSRIHHTIGLSAILFIIMHAMLITLSYSITANITPTEQFKVFISSYAYMIPAIIAFFAFIAIIFVSINLIRKKLKYEYWYYVHIFLYGAIILAFGHQLKLGQSLSSSLATTYWQIIFFGTIFCLIYYRFAKPLLRFKKYKFQVSNIVRENYNVLSIYISSKEAFSFSPEAGQFILVRFLTNELWWESHPFSLSSVPNSQTLRITPKELGDFTKKLSNLKKETKVIIEGPLGRFTANRAGKNSVLLIAGGIGITPIRGIFETLKERGNKTDLIYSARSNEDFVLKNELDSIGLVNYTTERLTGDYLKNTIPDIQNRFIFLCGPPPMMKSTIEILRNLGVPKKSILYEKFQLG